MEPEAFNAIQPFLGNIAERAEKQFDFEELRRLMAEPANAVGKLLNRSHNKHLFYPKALRGKNYV